MKKLLLVLITCLGAAWPVLAGDGLCLYERWMNETGGVDSMLLESATPDFTDTLTATIWDVEDLNNYRARITLWLTPQATGEYEFRIAVDDDMRIWLGETADPAAAATIVSRDGWVNVNDFNNANQYSGPIQLEAGRPYFLRAGMREGSGGDHIHVQWRGPGFDWQDISGPVMNSTIPVPIDVVTGAEQLVEFEHWNYVVLDNMLPLVVDIENYLPGFPAEPYSTGLLPLFIDTPGDPLGDDSGEGYVLRERGVIRLDEAKLVGFATDSDDATELFIGPWWEESPTYVHVVDNNGGHGTQYRGGVINLDAGYVGITVNQCEGTGGDFLDVYYWDADAQTSLIKFGPDQLISETQACVPSPANGSLAVATDTVLTWEKPWGLGVAEIDPTYEVYVWEQGTSMGTPAEVTVSEHDPDLDPGKAYSWRVDVIDPNEGGNPVRTTGLTWAFTTPEVQILVESQPADQMVDIGSDVTLSVQATGIGLPVTGYQWKKDGGELGGQTDASLVISGFGDSNNGTYTCVISNGTDTLETAGALVVGKKMLAYWPLDEHLEDRAEELDTNAAGDKDVQFLVNDPNIYDDDVLNPATVPYVTGKVGQAVAFNGVDEFAFAGTWNPNEVSKELSVSLWVSYGGDAGHWEGLIGKRNWWGADSMMWQVEQDESTDVLKTFQSNSGGGGSYTVQLPVAGASNKVSVGGRVLYSAQHTTNADERAYRAFDGLYNTKWLAFFNTAWLVYDFPADDAYIVTSYAITSGNDADGRDPDDWTIQGSNDGVNWDILDTQTGQAAGWTARNETRTFSLAGNTTAYQMYKLDVTKVRTPGDNIIQISEVELFADDVLDDAWVNMVATFDGATARTYLNGWFVREANMSFGPTTDASLVFGACEANPGGGPAEGSKPWGGNLYHGTLDEIKLVNWAMSPQEVLAGYLAVEGGPSDCFGVYPEGDFNQNCVVDTDDLLMLASEWLENQLSQ